LICQGVVRKKMKPQQIDKKITHPRGLTLSHLNLLVAHPCGNAPICSPLAA